MKDIVFHSVVYKEDKYYVAQCLDIDISSFGKTEKETLKNLYEAIELYLEDMPTNTLKLAGDPKLHTFRLQHA